MYKVVLILVLSLCAGLLFWGDAEHGKPIKVKQTEHSYVNRSALTNVKYNNGIDEHASVVRPALSQNENVAQMNYKAAYEKARPWFEAHGYMLLDGYIHPEDEDLVAYQGVASDYAVYGDDVLLQLSNDGDPIAQLYYGMKMLDTDLDTGVMWLRRSIVNGQYTSAIEQIMDAYQREINRLTGEMGQYGEQSEGGAVQSSENLRLISQYNSKIISWAFAAKHLKDPFVYERYIKYSRIEQSDFDQGIEQYEAQGRMLFNELAAERQSMGLTEFSLEEINADAFRVLFEYDE